MQRLMPHSSGMLVFENHHDFLEAMFGPSQHDRHMRTRAIHLRKLAIAAQVRASDALSVVNRPDRFAVGYDNDQGRYVLVRRGSEQRDEHIFTRVNHLAELAKAARALADRERR
jgi:hypothetical protein